MTTKTKPKTRKRTAKKDPVKNGSWTEVVPKSNGRPHSLTKKLAEEICVRLAAGESLRRICKDEHIPIKTTVLKWLLDERFVWFKDLYDSARKMQAEGLMDELHDIADDGSNDFIPDRDGNLVPDREHIARSTLRVNTRKWYLSKVLPRFKDTQEPEQSDFKPGKVTIEVVHANSSNSTSS